MLPRKIIRILTPKTPLSWVSESFIEAIEALEIGGLFHQGQFFCSGYEARPVQTTFPDFNLEFFCYQKIYLL